MMDSNCDSKGDKCKINTVVKYHRGHPQYVKQRVLNGGWRGGGGLLSYETDRYAHRKIIIMISNS